MVLFQTLIQNDERGLLFKNGNYIKSLQPGKYFLNPFVKYEVVKANANHAFNTAGKHLQIYLEDTELLKELTVIEVQDHEIAIHLEDGKLVEVLTSGKYAFWNVLKKHEFITIDIRNPEIDKKINVSIYNHPLLQQYVVHHHVQNWEQGILYYNNKFQKILEPGRYSYWKSPVDVYIQNIDLRQQQIDMTGQEMMTADKVSMRLNFVCHYKITDPRKVTQIKSPEEQMYIVLQLILREYVGTLKLDELLATKQEVGNYVLEKLQEKSSDFGVAFLFAGVKDVVLPGEMKEILNTVLIAEKRAQANVITRREETASTRSLLNTAKLMDENQTLYRLKELEFLEKICEKIGSISLNSGGNLLEQLNALLAKDTK
jgi:regulator of protease activity HflC (stomatin/prohibitin superfamily)